MKRSLETENTLAPLVIGTFFLYKSCNCIVIITLEDGYYTWDLVLEKADTDKTVTTAVNFI